MSIDSTEVLRQALNEYQARFEKLRQLTEETPRFQNTPDHRAKAYHSLLEAQAMAYRIALPTRAEHPLVHTRMWFADAFTLGGTSPDFYYGTIFLDGSKTYRLNGRFGEQKMIIMQAYSHVLGHKDSKMLGNFDLSQFDIEDDGSFEVIFSAEKKEGNWIPLDPDSNLNFFFIRRAIDDWNKDLGDITVTPLDKVERYDELNEELQAERILLAADLMTYFVEQWNIGIYDLYMKVNNNELNKLAVIGGETIAEDRMGSPSTYYMWGVYQIEDDEALIIEMDVPDAQYWSFQLFDVWCKPLDFINYQTDVNMNRASIDSDGKIRYVISHTDPGVANWLDPVGRKEGTLVGRNYLAKKVPNDPVVSLVKLSELSGKLPESTQAISPEERQVNLDYRRQGYLKMVDEIL